MFIYRFHDLAIPAIWNDDFSELPDFLWQFQHWTQGLSLKRVKGTDAIRQCLRRSGFPINVSLDPLICWRSWNFWPCDWRQGDSAFSHKNYCHICSSRCVERRLQWSSGILSCEFCIFIFADLFSKHHVRVYPASFCDQRISESCRPRQPPTIPMRFLKQTLASQEHGADVFVALLALDQAKAAFLDLFGKIVHIALELNPLYSPGAPSQDVFLQATWPRVQRSTQSQWLPDTSWKCEDW